MRVVHGVVDRGALGRVGAGHLRLPEHAAVDEAHHVERRAGDALVRAIDQRLGHRKFLRMQRADDAIFAVDRVRRRQQLARRLAAQDVTPRRRLQEISRVRLAALELLDCQRAGEARHMRVEISLKPRGIERSAGAASLVPEKACWRSRVVMVAPSFRGTIQRSAPSAHSGMTERSHFFTPNSIGASA